MEHSGMDTIQYEIVHIFQWKICFMSEILATLLKMDFFFFLNNWWCIKGPEEVPWIDLFQQSP